MKLSENLHTTNYSDTFIEVADDCPVFTAQEPPLKEDVKSVARIQYEIVKAHPYEFTSDDVLFRIYAMKNDIGDDEMEEQRKIFFSKGQACFRASPLTKRYGWGVHSDKEGKIAIYGRESEAYKKFAADKSLLHVKGMNSARKK